MAFQTGFPKSSCRCFGWSIPMVYYRARVTKVSALRGHTAFIKPLQPVIESGAWMPLCAVITSLEHKNSTGDSPEVYNNLRSENTEKQRVQYFFLDSRMMCTFWHFPFTLKETVEPFGCPCKGLNFEPQCCWWFVVCCPFFGQPSSVRVPGLPPMQAGSQDPRGGLPSVRSSLAQGSPVPHRASCGSTLRALIP